MFIFLVPNDNPKDIVAAIDKELAEDAESDCPVDEAGKDTVPGGSHATHAAAWDFS